MVLTANREVDHYIDQELRALAVAASTTIYKGALVGIKSDGYVRGLVAGDGFAGIAYENMDNSSGSDGDKSVRVYTEGDFGHAVASAVIGDMGRPVFGSADETMSYDGEGNSYVGTVIDFVSAGLVIVRLDVGGQRVKTITHAVEDLAANADIAARAIHAFTAAAWVVSARVVNQADAAAGIDASNTCTVTIKNGASTVVVEVFDDVTTFPAANAQQTLGTVANQRAAKGDELTLTVLNGTNADPGPFLVEIDYV